MTDNKKGVLYDFDGTLGNTFDLHIQAYRAAIALFGLNPSIPEVISKCFGKTDNQAAANFHIKEVEIFSSHYRKTFQAGLGSVKLYPHVIAALEYLASRNISILLGTMRTAEEMKLVFSSQPIEKYFSAIATHESEEVQNPKTNIFRRCIEKEALRANDCMAVGDSLSDMLAAQEIGMKKFLFFPQGHEKYYSQDEFKGLAAPDAVFSDHLQIRQVV